MVADLLCTAISADEPKSYPQKNAMLDPLGKIIGKGFPDDFSHSWHTCMCARAHENVEKNALVGTANHTKQCKEFKCRKPPQERSPFYAQHLRQNRVGQTSD